MLGSLIFACLIWTSFCAKILIYNPAHNFATSHRRFMGNLAETLQNDGHQITMLQPYSDEDVLTTGLSNNSNVKIYRFPTNNAVHVNLTYFNNMMWNYKADEILPLMNQVCSVFEDSCRRQLENSEILKQLENENFDLGIAEFFDACGFAIFEQIKLKKFITVFTAMIYDNIPDALGIPQAPSFVPNELGSFTPNMTFRQRAHNLHIYITTELYFRRITTHSEFIDDIMVNITGKNFNVLKKAMSASCIFVNSEEHLEFPRPISHKLIYIGGFDFPKQVNKPVLIDESVAKKGKGMVLVAFGSVLKTNHIIDNLNHAILNSTRNFPDVVFLIKDDVKHGIWDENYPNVYYQKWFPQVDLLNYNHTLAMITHAGMNTAIELAYSGCPTLNLPQSADQFRNAALFTYRKTGITLQKHETTVESITEALKKIIHEPEIRQNAQKLASVIKSKPFSAKERLLKYVNFTVEHGDKDYLDLPGRHLNFVERYSIDVIAKALGWSDSDLEAAFWKVHKNLNNL